MRVVEACNSKNEIVLEPLKHATASGKSLASRSTKGKAKECKRDDKRKLVIASLVGLAPLASQELKQEKASDRFARGARSARLPGRQKQRKSIWRNKKQQKATQYKDKWQKAAQEIPKKTLETSK